MVCGCGRFADADGCGWSANFADADGCGFKLICGYFADADFYGYPQIIRKWGMRVIIIGNNILYSFKITNV